MTSETRAYVLVLALTVGAMGNYGRDVERWSIRNVFGIIAAGAFALAAGVLKSPRDGKLSDDATPPVVSADVKTETISTSHAEAPKE